MFIFFFSFILSDNIILNKKICSKLKYNFNSNLLKDNQQIKISYPGIFYLELTKDNNKYFIKDKTVYYKKIPIKMVIEVENIFFYLPKSTWNFIIYLIFVTIISFILIYKLIYHYNILEK